MAYIKDVLDQNLPLLMQLKSRIADVLPEFKNDFHRSDLSLLRFIVARDFNLDKAEEMVRQNLQWRKMNSVDSITSIRLPEDMRECHPMMFSGYDKRGCPVVYNPISEWDGPKVLKLGRRAECFTRLRQHGDRLMDIFEKSPIENTIQSYAIYDMEGYDYSELFSIELCKLTRESFQDYLDNYPETLGPIRVINAPRLFQIVWAIIDPILTGRTKSKIQIHGTDKEKWKAALLKEVDPDNLPSRCGGSVTTCFPYKMQDGLNVFPSHETLPEELFQQAVIPARQKHYADYVLKEGEKLSWNFKTEDHDIGFSVDTELKKSVVRYCRVDSHKFVQKGTITATSPGKYSLIFDNSFSKFTPKKLSFAIKHYRH